MVMRIRTFNDVDPESIVRIWKIIYGGIFSEFQLVWIRFRNFNYAVLELELHLRRSKTEISTILIRIVIA